MTDTTNTVLATSDLCPHPPLPAYVTHEWLAHLQLRDGAGTGEVGNACLIQEVRRAIGLDPSSDVIPACTSDIIGGMAIRVQDARADWRAECRELLPLLIGSRGSVALEKRRVWRIVDWTIRECIPASVSAYAASLRRRYGVLGAEGTTAIALRANSLRDLPPITDATTAKAAVDPLRAFARVLEREHDLSMLLCSNYGLANILGIELAFRLGEIFGFSVAPEAAPVALLRELLAMRESGGDAHASV